MKEIKMKITARDLLISIADEFQNNYLTVERFAECNGLTFDQACQTISLAQAVRASKHPEA